MEFKIPVKLLKIFILLGLTSEFPAKLCSPTGLGRDSQQLAEGSSLINTDYSVSASPPATTATTTTTTTTAVSNKTATQGASGGNDTSTQASREAAGDSVVASYLLTSPENSSSGGADSSITRSGIQSSESGSQGDNSAGSELPKSDISQVGPGLRLHSHQHNEQQLQQTVDSPPMANNHRSSAHLGAANHRNSPIEPYPSASYTTLTIASQPASVATSSSNSSPTTLANHQTAGDSISAFDFLNRDHHHNAASSASAADQHNLASSGLVGGQDELTDTNSQRGASNAGSSSAANHRPSSQLLSSGTSSLGALLGQANNNNLKSHYDTQNAYNQIFNYQNLGGGGTSSSSSSALSSIPTISYNGDHTLSSSYSNPAPSSSSAAASSLNAGLIQNLTAGLFPVNKLSNGTLLSLSELLNKTKQANNSTNFGSSGGSAASQILSALGITNRPSYNNNNLIGNYAPSSSGGRGGTAGKAAATNHHLTATQQQSQPQTSANYLEALLGDRRLSSMLDYITSNTPQVMGSSGSAFGLREPSPTSIGRYQTPASLINRLIPIVTSGGSSSNNNNNNNNNLANQLYQPTQLASGYGNKNNKHDLITEQLITGRPPPMSSINAGQNSKSSNVYNTYLPYSSSRDSLKQLATQTTRPLMTNGQMLNMAATLYDSYLDENYRSYKQDGGGGASSLAKSAFRESTFRPNSEDSLNHNQYQFIQHHNSNNQNHLDRVVYHSTPFRPSIVSPPATLQQSHQLQSQSQAQGGGGSVSVNGGGGGGTVAMLQNNSTAPQHHQYQHQQQHQHGLNAAAAIPQQYLTPKTEADSKQSITYSGAPLSNIGNALLLNSNNNYRHHNLNQFVGDFALNSQQQQVGPNMASGNTTHSNAPPNRFVPNLVPNDKHESDFDSIYDHIRSHYRLNSAAQNNHNNSNSVGLALSQLNGSSGNNVTLASASKMSPRKQQASQQQQQATSMGTPTATTITPTSASSMSGPQLLLDLYERAIDNQIQEAIYSDHQQHFQHLAGPLASELTSGSASASNSLDSITNSFGAAQPVASASSQSSWPYDDRGAPLEPTTPSFMNAAAAAVGLPLEQYASYDQQQQHQHHLAKLPMSGNGVGNMQSMAGASTQLSQQTLIDPLTMALQELPTFSASDLQPMVPVGRGEPAYSLLAPSSTSGGGGSAHSISPGSPSSSLMTSASLSQHFAQANALDSMPSHDQYDTSSLAALASQLFESMLAVPSPPPQATRQYSQLFADQDAASLSYPYGSSISGSSLRPTASSYQQAAQTTLSSHHQHPPSTSLSSTSTGLPALLTKLHSGQLSSILTSPFAHLYASLPRYRYTKAKQTSPTRQPGSTTKDSGASSTSGTGNAMASKQQMATSLAAAQAANLMAAASGQTLTPLQAALVQAQAATSAYLSSEPLVADQHAIGQSTVPTEATTAGQKRQQHNQQQQQQQASSLALLNLASGLAGGGVSPLVWRNILAPINWARKQTLSSASNGTSSDSSAGLSVGSNQHNSHGSQQTSLRPATSSGHLSLRHSLSQQPLINSIWNNNNNNNNNYPYSVQQLFSAPVTSATAASASFLSNVPTSGQEQGGGGGGGNRAQGKLRIKILKIPVAFLDNSSPSSGQFGDSAASSNSNLFGDYPSPSSMSLMPAHLQPTPTASLLASLSCPLHNHSNLADNTIQATTQQQQQQQQQNLKQQNQLTDQYQIDEQQSSPFGSSMRFMGTGGGGDSSSHQTSLHSPSAAAATATSDQKPISIRDFTDINQSNDLQVSPSSNSIKLITLTPKANNHQLQQQQYDSKSS